MSEARRRMAAQMTRDGITKLPAWSKGRKVGCAVMRHPLARPYCEATGCHKKAGYDTPQGKRCFEHALPKEHGA